MITNSHVRDHLLAYLNHQIGLKDLVNWAEDAMLMGEFDPDSAHVISEVVARLGIADVREFGLTWEDCSHLLSKLGYSPKVTLEPIG